MENLQDTIDRCNRLAIIGQLLETFDTYRMRETVVERLRGAGLISDTGRELLRETYCREAA